jgi:c-di-GMP-binding flagellar brake protein YcgR
VVASFFAPDALYRMKATLTPHGGREAVIDLDVHDIERVQRRTAPRARLSLPVVMSNFDDPATDDPSFTSVKGQSVDIGEGGCRVVVPRPFPSGCDPTVTLQLPSGDTVVALAAVLQAAAVSSGGYEYRLVFLEMDELDRLRLAELVTTPTPA